MVYDHLKEFCVTVLLIEAKASSSGLTLSILAVSTKYLMDYIAERYILLLPHYTGLKPINKFCHVGEID